MFNRKTVSSEFYNILYIVSAVYEQIWSTGGVVVTGENWSTGWQEEGGWERSRCQFFHHQSHKLATRHLRCFLTVEYSLIQYVSRIRSFSFVHDITTHQATFAHCIMSDTAIYPPLSRRFDTPASSNAIELLSELRTSLLGQSQVYQQYCRHVNCTHCRSYHYKHACLLSEHNAYEWRERWRTADPRWLM